jgi:hypothetical protein
MSEHWIEDDGLRFEGLSPAEIAQFWAAAPALQQFIALAEKNENDFTHMFMLAKSLLPTANMIAAKMKERAK